jgi:CubicO group peptidase (beta-lactamase class C family)
MNLNTNNTCRALLLVCSTFTISCTSQAEQPNNQTGNTLAANIDQLLTSQNLPGLVMLVRKNNKIIHHKAYGYADIEAKIPIKKDALFRLNSMTKPITALTTLQVLAEKNIALNSPLQAVFPQFDQHPDIPLSTVLTHTSGFSYGFKINRWAGWLYLFSDIGDSQTLPEFIGHLAELPLLSTPGVRWRYSFSSDVQGAMVEQLTDRKLSENMQTRIFSKLGMVDTSFYVEPERADRLAPLYSNNWFGSRPNKKEGGDVTQAQGAESGGSGLVSTVQDYSKFVQLLMTPESYPDIVRSEHAALMTTSQLPKDIPIIPERYYTNSGYSYGLGVKLKDEQYLSKGSFYWAGRGGTVFWADPEKALSVVVMMQYEGGNKILEKELIPMVYNWLEQRENTPN